MGIFRRSDKPEAPAAPGLLSRLQSRLSATREHITRGLGDLLLGKRALDDALFEELETRLIGSDLGVDLTRELLETLTERVARKELADAGAVYAALKRLLLDIVRPCAVPLKIPDAGRPFCVMVVGVNGAGKTTTIGKIAGQLAARGMKVLLAAGDTFRAAAIEQLMVWGERTGVAVIHQNLGADAASVAHDAMQAARARKSQILLIDTAGRLQTQSGLMDELRKIRRVIARADPAAPDEVLLVLDAAVGQNALSQLQHFREAVGVTGLCVTKLDGTARAGILF
ncbi:MAG TPA: signal recognition particle-docking protein FtsY, partial [Acidiferrobacteraceae bacterium]|nr:signal recognition particle-docking protein FtsY [Acidiferrobacteraceae bacterium]